MGGTRREQVIRLSQRITELRAERARQTAEIDAEIRRQEAKLERLMSGGTATAARSRRRANGRIGKGDKIVRLLKREPGMDYSELTRRVYRADNPQNRAKLRGNIYALQKAKRIKPLPGGRSRWGAVIEET